MSTRNILSKRCENDIEKQYDFYWHGILVGIVIVPLNEDKPVDFVANSVINMDVARQSARFIYKKFARDISVQHGKKIVLLKRNYFEKDPDKNNKHKKSHDGLNWKIYNHNKMYMGKVAEIKSKKGPAVALCIKNNVFVEDIIDSIQSLLKKYSVIQLTKKGNSDELMIVEKDTELVVIEYYLVNKFHIEKKYKTVEKKAPVVVKQKIKSDTPRGSLVMKDPILMSKMLSVTLTQKQINNGGVEKWQQRANEQMTPIKILDSDGKLVDTVYPEDVEKIRNERIEKIRNMAREIVY